MINDAILVSVVIVTYNSAETIIETLNSISEQTYKKIEIIISDDNSKDNTISIVEDWITSNRERFYRTEIIKSCVNTGVSPNLNRGVRAARGTWIKTLAGDDLLTKDAIQTYCTFVQNHYECNICMSKIKCFGINLQMIEEQEIILQQMYKKICNKSKEEQLNYAIIEHILPGPALFYTKKLWEDIGGFDERFPFAEEYPFELKVFQKYRVFLIDKKLVEWRIRPNSLCHSFNWKNFNSEKEIFNKIRKDIMLQNGLWFYALDTKINFLTAEKHFQNKSIIWKILHLISPIWWKKVLTNKNHI